MYLVEHAGQLVSKDELLDAVWPEAVVADSVLMVKISELRKVLGDSARVPQYIATEHRRGYRFIAPVMPMEPSALPALSTPVAQPPAVASALPAPLATEWRQLTVLCCDLVDSTRLAGRLDPEDLREVLHAYHQSCGEVVARFDGYVAQYLGDGVLVYFGYPVAHEDDAQRAVWSGLGLLEALSALNARLALPSGSRLAVRLGLHTGLVVVGNVGSGERRERLAQGETPHIAAGLQRLAGANELIISAATRDLLGGMFRVKDLGEQELRGLSTPMQIYRVEGAQEVESRFEAMTVTDLTPLVGREEELALLWRCWQQATEGEGQVVLLSGEAGLGKSRLTQALCERLANEPHLRVLYQCSPYHTHSAFYPIITHLDRTLQLDQVPLSTAKLDRLETLLAKAGLVVSEMAPLLASLLSIPTGNRYRPLLLSPQRQRELTIEALVAQLVSLSQREPLLLIVEDAHWSDPSTLDVLDRLINGLQEAAVLAVITYRPAFEPRWRSYGHVTTYSLNRLTRRQVAALVTEVTDHKALPPEVLDHIVAKTDGVPFFVEELTKTVLASGLLEAQGNRYALRRPLPPLAIPSTLQDALMARLDSMESAKAVAQYAAVMGRQVSYEVLEAVSPLDTATLQYELGRLVQAELLYQRGLPPQATYTFKHALIQDSAYQSLLRSTKQVYHQRIAEMLETRFPEMVATQPELLARHYTESGRHGAAARYWQQAGEKALQRSANVEAIAYLTQGLEVLKTLPDTPERLQCELALQTALGPALMVIKGHGAPDTKRAYARARELCEQLGDAPQLFTALRGMMTNHMGQGNLQTAYQLGEQLRRLAQARTEPAYLLLAHFSLGQVLFWRGDLAAAYAHHTEALTIYTPQDCRNLAAHYGLDLVVASHSYLAWELWQLGYPDQALLSSQMAERLAQEVAHPFSLNIALIWSAILHQWRREAPAAHDLAVASTTVATQQGFVFCLARATILHGWALAMQGQGGAGIAEIRQGLAASLSTGDSGWQPYFLGLMAEAYGEDGHYEAGLNTLAEALAMMDAMEVRFYGAELYRLKGELSLRQSSNNETEAESCFQQAITFAQTQSAKSWELRAATNLSRLWQQQGKHDEARELLAPVYGWFTEGFDTADLQAAQGLLEALSV